MPPDPDVIVPVLIEQYPTTLTPDICTIPNKAKIQIAKIVERGLAAKQIVEDRTRAISRLDGRLTDAIIALLESPTGLTGGELASVTELEDATAATRALRSKLKKDGKYKLKKAKSGNYVLDPIR